MIVRVVEIDPSGGRDVGARAWVGVVELPGEGPEADSALFLMPKRFTSQPETQEAVELLYSRPLLGASIRRRYRPEAAEEIPCWAAVCWATAGGLTDGRKTASRLTFQMLDPEVQHLVFVDVGLAALILGSLAKIAWPEWESTSSIASQGMAAIHQSRVGQAAATRRAALTLVGDN